MPPGLDRKARITVSAGGHDAPEELLAIGVGAAGESAGPFYDLVLRREGKGDPMLEPQLVVAEIRVRTKDKTEPTGDRLPLVETAPLISWSVPTITTVTVHADEEALADWFVAAVAREEQLRAASPDQQKDSEKPRALRLGKPESQKLTRFIAELVRFRLGGMRQGTDGDPLPRELAAALRWPMWWNGSDRISTWILLTIYWLTCLGIATAAVRLFRVLPILRNDQSRLHWPFLRTGYLAWKTTDANGAGVEAWKDGFDRQDTLSRFIEYALPATGFLGTISGLGEAFGTVGIISKIELMQRLSLMSVLLDLGTAFSTTFWALAAGLLLTPAFMLVRALESRAAEVRG